MPLPKLAIFELLLLLLLLAAVPLASCQQLTPFQGRNSPPDGGTDVHISVVVDHLVGIDELNYRFEAVLYVLLTWKDPRAYAAIQNATRQAINDASNYNNGNGCEFPCTTVYKWRAKPGANTTCCDDIWLPHFEMINVYALPGDGIARYGIRVRETDQETVGYFVHVQAEFYTPLQFRSFPFDKQYLNIQMQYGRKPFNGNVTLIPSATGTQLYSPNSGEKLSGWTVKKVHIHNITVDQQKLLRAGANDYSASSDPWPLNPTNPAEEPYGGVLWHTGFEIYIEVDRISTYYVITAILPICINTLLALLVFSISPRKLDTRLGIVVTLFLSLTALQYVIAVGLPSSSTVVPTQQLIIVSYCILAGVGVSSIIVYWMVSLHRTRERRRRLKHARRVFSSRWRSLTSSLGEAASDSMMVRRKTGSSSVESDGSMLKHVSFRDGACGMGRAATEQQQQQQERAVGRGIAGTPLAAASVAAAALPASPFASGMPQAAAGKEGQQQVPTEQPFAATPAAGELSGVAGQRPQHPGLQARASERQQAAGQSVLVHPAATTVKKRAGKGGRPLSQPVQSDSKGSDSGSDSNDDSNTNDSDSSSDEGFLQVAEVPDLPPGAAAAVDEEGAESSLRQRRKWARRRQALFCCLPAASVQRGGGGSSSGEAHRKTPSKHNWFMLLWLKLQLIQEEMRESQDYATHIAAWIDRFIFWATIVGFIISVILIFAIQAQIQPHPDLEWERGWASRT